MPAMLGTGDVVRTKQANMPRNGQTKANTQVNIRWQAKPPNRYELLVETVWGFKTCVFFHKCCEKYLQVWGLSLRLKAWKGKRGGRALGGRDESERRRAESQWIVAARPLCHLQYPVAYLSRLQRILPAA